VWSWYSEVLTRSKEPSLFALTKVKSVQSYRFLWLRSFNDDIVIRLDIHAEGTATLVEKVLGDRMSGTPGQVIHQEQRIISADKTAAFLKHLKDDQFWSLQTDIHKSECDGAEWVIEGVRDGSYHLVTRWSPENGPIHDLGLELALNLAGMKIPKGKLY
jgi:hypothetical protein